MRIVRAGLMPSAAAAAWSDVVLNGVGRTLCAALLHYLGDRAGCGTFHMRKRAVVAAFSSVKRP